MKTLLVFGICILGICAYAEPSETEKLWIKRAEKAIARGQELNANFKGKKMPDEAYCELLLEKAYSMFESPESRKLMISKSAKSTSFKMLFKQEKGKELNEVDVLYNDSGSPVALAVPKLTKGWGVFHFSGMNSLALVGDSCHFEIPTGDPLAAKALVSKQ
jgi:hypothetical protein